MTSFDETDPATILHFLSRFRDECDLEQILEVPACLIIPKFLNGIVLIISSRLGTLRHTPDCATGQSTSTDSSPHTLRQPQFGTKSWSFKEKQLPLETEVEFSAWANTVAYRCDNAFTLENKISTFVFGLKSAIQTIVAYETEELENTRRIFKNVTQLARKGVDAYRAHLPKSIVAQEALYTSPRQQEDEDEALLMYGKRKDLSFQSTSENVVQSPKTPGATNDYRQDRPEWIDQPLSHEKSSVFCNIVCHQCYAHGQYSLDRRLSYGRWKEIIANFESLVSFDQKQVPRNSLQIAVFANKTAWNNFEHLNATVVNVNREHCSTSRPRQIASRPSDRTRNDKPGNHYVNLLDEVSRLLPISVDLKKLEDMFLLKK